MEILSEEVTVQQKETLIIRSLGTIIRVRNTDNDIVATFNKADNGSLPDAVIDIWKTGVEDLGLTWHSYTSFSARYSYNF
ncbi:hypothetical protein AV545_03505 [Paenibacillus jamilae]|nr:hypothetical protein AV545_03505 [Paenibacillus jamilae]